jgi:hypothetical protein
VISVTLKSRPPGRGYALAANDQEEHMPTVLVFHEVENGKRWAAGWRSGSGRRREMFAAIGVTARTFRDPDNPDNVGLILDVPDMDKLQALAGSDEAKRARAEDGLKNETIRILHEFTP